jgi:pimeloyl-ACP methyl ester carboxylesterase
MSPHGAADQALPAWFVQAVEKPRSAHALASADGTALHLVGWNDEERHKAPLLLLHGFLGNTHWWDFTAPFLTANHRVYALDLAGMGSSAWRAQYTTDGFAADVVAAARFLSSSLPALPISAISHSFAGSRLLEACVREPDLFARAIVVDSRLSLADDQPLGLSRSARPARPSADRQTHVSRFRLVPDQPHLHFLKTYLAEHALRETAQGWTWKFDPQLPSGLLGQPLESFAGRIRTPVDLLIGELSSVVSSERAERIARLIPRSRGPIIVPQANHHLMLDQPLALIACLRALLACPPSP